MVSVKLSVEEIVVRIINGVAETLNRVNAVTQMKCVAGILDHPSLIIVLRHARIRLSIQLHAARIMKKIIAVRVVLPLHLV